jgi:hypothetical protein
MEINIDDEYKNKVDKLTKDKNIEDYTKFYKIDELKVSLINIDSAYREQIPKNIYSLSNLGYLPNNPITFVENSSILNINYPNHKLNVDDKIIIQNVNPLNYVINDHIFLFQNYSYFFININHNINLQYLNLLVPIKIQISIFDSLSIENKQYYGNIPINSIIGTFNVNLPSVIDNIIPMYSLILDYFNVTNASELDNNYILIELPFNYYDGTNEIYVISDFYKISFMDLGGIPLNGINADYPINNVQLQNFQQVQQVIDLNNFTVQCNYKANYSGIGGGDKIQIMKIINTINGYPDANNYTIKLKKNFSNIVRIELVSTEFPFIDYLIQTSGINKNNKIYWKHLNDGNHIYSAEIPEGNYDINSLITILTNNMNAIPRIISTTEKQIYNLFTITINSFTQEVKIITEKIDDLPNSLKIDIVSINDSDYYRLIVRQANNLVKPNDMVTIYNSDDIGNISKIYINKSHTVYSIDINNNIYYILLGLTNQISSNVNLYKTLIDNGGGAISIKTQAHISLLFNYPDTIGNLLGFKNVGSSNAITPFNNIISNFDAYINDTNLNVVGNITLSNKILNFTGKNNYYLLYINDYELITNNFNQNPAFAKILLSGSIGDILYNTFINYPLEFENPLSTLNELNIKITFADGTLPNFKNIDHSFTLKITELINYPKNTKINSNKTNYLQTMKDIYYNK